MLLSQNINDIMLEMWKSASFSTIFQVERNYLREQEMAGAEQCRPEDKLAQQVRKQHVVFKEPRQVEDEL
jgi:hypothetical protein